ncbi:MAG: TetR/AcrR family transcriptional regulator [Paenisporosarcina sp.]
MSITTEQQLKMRAKRERILDEAIRLFSEQGYNDTTISKVAKEAGISFGSVFTYFATKEELFYSAITEPLEKFSVELLDFNPKADHPLDELNSMIQKHIKQFSYYSLFLRLVVQVIGQHKRFEEPFRELNLFHIRFREKIAELVENGQQKGVLLKLDPFFVTTSYTSFLMGLRLNLADDPDHEMWWAEYAPYALQLFGPNRN